ncbi:hypothetical protein PINS_up005232 [Pythium insidiosum]|nr:hypothetical protein PINS_up005232 [Pythium insidiosum]
MYPRKQRAASLSKVTPARMLSLVTHGVAKAPPWVLAKAKKEHLFQLEAAAALPVLNLRRTLSWLALSPERNLRFLRWTKRRFRALTLAHRVGGLLAFTSLVMPVAAQHHAVMWTLALSSLVLSTPASLCTAATLSVDMVAILLRHYEFWFFTAVNALTWGSLAVLVGLDARLLCLASTWGSVQLSILMDANFRTFVPAVKSSVLALPLLLGLALIASFRVLGIADAHYVVLTVVRCRVDVVDVFLNALLTLCVFFLRKTYNKRRLLRSRNANTHLVRCCRRARGARHALDARQRPWVQHRRSRTAARALHRYCDCNCYNSSSIGAEEEQGRAPLGAHTHARRAQKARDHGAQGRAGAAARATAAPQPAAHARLAPTKHDRRATHRVAVVRATPTAASLVAGDARAAVRRRRLGAAVLERCAATADAARNSTQELASAH